MKALFVAPDLAVIANLVSMVSSVDEFKEGASEFTEEDYGKQTKDIFENPANKRFTWVQFEKTENDIDFFSNLAILSANNSYTASEKDILMTQDSVFINVNLLDAFKTVASSNSEDGSVDFDIDLANKSSYHAFKAITDNMFADGENARFHELVTTDNGPQLFMLSGCFTNDTWSIFENIGPTARKGVLMQKDYDCNKKYPGICLLFGLSMNALAQIASRMDVFPEHIRKDFETLPRNEENEAD